MRATVLGQTWMSTVASSCAIFSAVRWVQRTPVMGSPATSYPSAASMAAIIAGVFFQGRPPATGAAHALALDLPGEQLLASSGHGTGVDTEQPGDAGVAAPTALQRFQAGIQAALAFVEQAGEQHDSGAQFVGHEVAIRYRSDQPGGGQQGAPRAHLLRLAGPIGGAIQELTGKLVAGQLAFLDQLAQGILGADMQQVVQLFAELSSGSVVDHRCGGGEQGTGG